MTRNGNGGTNGNEPNIPKPPSVPIPKPKALPTIAAGLALLLVLVVAPGLIEGAR